MANYVDGFVVPVPKKKIEAYRRMALKAGEVVWFSWIVYKSRKHRDSVNKKVMKDPRLAGMMDLKALPFDAKRMIYGGFKVVVGF